MTYSIDQLTHKNQEFIRIATNQLIKDGKSDQEIQAYLEEIIPEIIAHQNKGITARSLYGSPTQWALDKSQVAETSNRSDENDDPKLMYMDSVLLIFGLLGALNGIINSFSTTSTAYGLTMLLAISLVGGGVFYAMYHYIYRFYEAGKTKDRPGFTKSIMIIAGATVLWIGTITLFTFLPDALNPKVPGFVLLILGLLVLALRFYLKKRFNIKSSMQTRR